MNVAKTLTLTLAAAWLAFAAPAAAEAQQDGKRLPTELWEEYPLDPTGGHEPRQSDAPQPTTTAERSVPPAAQPPSSVAQEEGSNLWRMPAMTIGLAALAGILVALIVIGLSNVLARGRWRLIQAPGSAPKRAWRSEHRVDEDLRSEVGALVLLAERSRGGTFGRRSRNVAVPEKAAQPAKEAAPAPKEAAPPRLRTSLKTRPKKLPTAGAPPPKKQLPGLSPPKKEGLIPAGLPPGKALGPVNGAPPAKAGEQPEDPGPRPRKALSARLEPPARGRRSDAGRPTLRQDQ